MPNDMEIEIRSPALACREPTAVVTLPTFRRPEHLRKTLDSLKAQSFGRPFAVIVMENDAERREGLEAARPFFEEGKLDGLVLIAHERGNCSAYNAGWATALAEFPSMRHLLVIDDDETADSGWIETLVRTAESLGADIVGGPQVPRFEEPGAAHYARHPIFTPHYSETGRVPIVYSSGNVLIGRHVLEAMGAPFLDTAFNFIGGGDSDFYFRCRRQGFAFAWCAEAPVYETQPARRTERSWLRDRGLRNGALSSIIERRLDGSALGHLRVLAKSGALLAASPFRALALTARTGSPAIGAYPLHVAAGRLLAELGVVNEQYRNPEQN